MSKMLGVSAQTLRNWDKSGKLKPHHKSANGYRYYEQNDLNMLLGIKSKTGKAVGYCRVDSIKQKNNLEHQKANIQTYLLAQGKPFEIISDVGSGFDYNRKGLQELIKGMANRSIAKIVTLNKDIIAKFGFELIEYIAKLYDCEIEIINTSNEIKEQEVIKDLMEILTVMNRKSQNKYENKIVNKIIKGLNEND